MNINIFHSINNIRQPDRNPDVSYTEYVETTVYGHVVRMGLDGLVLVSHCSKRTFQIYIHTYIDTHVICVYICVCVCIYMCVCAYTAYSKPCRYILLVQVDGEVVAPGFDLDDEAIIVSYLSDRDLVLTTGKLH